jgi:hypothetical protein
MRRELVLTHISKFCVGDGLDGELWWSLGSGGGGSSGVGALDGLCLLDTPDDSADPRELSLLSFTAAIDGSTTCAGPRL